MGKDLRHPKRLWAFPRQPKVLIFKDKVEVPETIYNRDKAKEEVKALIKEELELEKEGHDELEKEGYDELERGGYDETD
jgi:hypothetical protein